MRTELFAVVSMSMLVTGCTTKEWVANDFVPASLTERQKTADRGYCRRVSVGSAPMPTVSHRLSPPTYDISGTVRRPGGYSDHFTATATPRANFGDSFMSGAATGAQLRATIDTRIAQTEIFDGCMAALGWRTKDQPSACQFPEGHVVSDPLRLYPECRSRAP